MKALPASEIVGWIQYFSIFPFQTVREYEQTALIAQTVSNAIKALMAQNSGKRTFKPVPINMFLPDFLHEKSNKGKSVEQQHAAWGAFVADAKAKGIS